MAHRCGMMAFAVLLAVLFNASGHPARAQVSGEAKAQALRPIVVKISARLKPGTSPQVGFGFVVGEQNGQVVIVTANHLVRGGLPDQEDKTPRITFFERQGVEVVGKLQNVNLPSTRGDLTVILAPKPSKFSFSSVAQSLTPVTPTDRGLEVWPIGRANAWNVPVTPGRVSRVNPVDGHIIVEGLDVRRGSSGGPLVSKDGIVGMIVADGDLETEVVPIEAIQKVVQREWRYAWQFESSLTADSVAGKAESVCSDLKALVSMSEHEFASIRKGQLHGDDWESSVSVFGFKSCQIQKLNAVTFICEGTPVSSEASGRQKIDQLAQGTEACLGSAWRRNAISPDLIGIGHAPSGVSVLYSLVKSRINPESPQTYVPSIQVFQRREIAAVVEPEKPAKKPEEYCEQLNKVVKSAENRFDDIIGRRSQAGSRLMSRIQLNGWQACDINEPEQKKEGRWFSCGLSPIATAAAADTLNDEISADLKICLGPNWAAKRRRLNSGQMDIEFISLDVPASVELRSRKGLNNIWEIKLEVNLDN
jgi:Trypsin-like peptidase domain